MSVTVSDGFEYEKIYLLTKNRHWSQSVTLTCVTVSVRPCMGMGSPRNNMNLEIFFYLGNLAERTIWLIYSMSLWECNKYFSLQISGKYVGWVKWLAQWHARDSRNLAYIFSCISVLYKVVWFLHVTLAVVSAFELPLFYPPFLGFTRRRRTWREEEDWTGGDCHTEWEGD